MIQESALQAALLQAGQPAFRVKQIQKWFYHKGVPDFAQMSDLPEDLRAVLAEKIRPVSLQILDKQESSDQQTTKLLLGTRDQRRLEMVLLRNQTGRTSVCISSQIGCALRCAFCATGRSGFGRDLTAEEIFDQIWLARSVLQAEKPDTSAPDNVIVMGMGEPFLNYDQTLQALRWANKYLQLGGRRLTISTSGIIEGIKRFAKEPEQFNLAVSLHSVDQEVRDRLMPVSLANPLVELRKAIVSYAEQTKRKVFFEYLLLSGINDRDQDARDLAKWLPERLSHVNLIRYNQVEGLEFQSPSGNRVQAFQQILQDQGLPVTIRHPMGEDIQAACGQLASSN